MALNANVETATARTPIDRLSRVFMAGETTTKERRATVVNDSNKGRGKEI
jgi:hypothetical protein